METRLALLRLLLGYRLSQALVVAAELGVADLLAAGPRPVDALAAATGAHAPALHRVLRLLASEGVFVEAAPGYFALTPLAEPLREDAPDSLRPRARFDGAAWNWRAWGTLRESVLTGEPAFDRAHGVGLFAYLQGDPAAAEVFHRHVDALTSASTRDVLDAYDFPGARTLVDVGGGHGAMLVAALRAQPELGGVLFDRPHVVAAARPRLAAAGVGDRGEAVAGDFFAAVPAGGDTYLLKYILHDWDDARCRAILANCRRALPAGGRLVVVEALLQSGHGADYAKYLDVTMLALTAGGRERTEAEYRALLNAAGFRVARVLPTRSELAVIEAVPAA